MITITKQPNEISIQGHAEYAPVGQDIVCAAISSLTQAFIVSLEQLTDAEIKCDISAGNAVIRYMELPTDAQLLVDSFFIGCGLVADEYPQYVRIENNSNGLGE